jgi:hypothetical protein
MDGTGEVEGQGAMAGARFEDFQRRLGLARSRGVDMDIKEGDNQVSIMRIDLSGVSSCGGGRGS